MSSTSSRLRVGSGPLVIMNTGRCPPVDAKAGRRNPAVRIMVATDPTSQSVCVQVRIGWRAWHDGLARIAGADPALVGCGARSQSSSSSALGTRLEYCNRPGPRDDLLARLIARRRQAGPCLAARALEYILLESQGPICRRHREPGPASDALLGLGLARRTPQPASMDTSAPGSAKDPWSFDVLSLLRSALCSHRRSE